MTNTTADPFSTEAMYDFGFAEGSADKLGGDAHAELLEDEDGADYCAGYRAGWASIERIG